MIQKIGIYVSLLLLVLTFWPVQTDSWRKTNFLLPITKQFVEKFIVDSLLRCFVHCSTYFSTPLVTIQDGDCYCLTSYPDFHWTGGEVTLTSFMYRRSVQSDCISKAYDIYPDLGVCIKYIGLQKTWLDAERRCNQDGGYLLNVDTQDKFTASINIMISESEAQVFVGGISTFWDGGNTKYHWTRGGEIGSSFWLGYQPSFEEVESCLTMFHINGIAEGLNNFVCNISQPFLCELLL